jgi:ribonucrease Y
VIEKRYEDLAKAEERVDNRSAAQDRQAIKLEQREQKLNKRQSRLDKSFNDLSQVEEEHRLKLEEVASMTSEEAKGVLLAEVEKESRQDMARVMREIEDEARETADAKRVTSSPWQSSASPATRWRK